MPTDPDQNRDPYRARTSPDDPYQRSPDGRSRSTPQVTPSAFAATVSAGDYAVYVDPRFTAFARDVSRDDPDRFLAAVQGRLNDSGTGRAFVNEALPVEADRNNRVFVEGVRQGFRAVPANSQDLSDPVFARGVEYGRQVQMPGTPVARPQAGAYPYGGSNWTPDGQFRATTYLPSPAQAAAYGGVPLKGNNGILVDTRFGEFARKVSPENHRGFLDAIYARLNAQDPTGARSHEALPVEADRNNRAFVDGARHGFQAQPANSQRLSNPDFARGAEYGRQFQPAARGTDLPQATAQAAPVPQRTPDLPQEHTVSSAASVRSTSPSTAQRPTPSSPGQPPDTRLRAASMTSSRSTTTPGTPPSDSGRAVPQAPKPSVSPGSGPAPGGPGG
jgi:hypothetical protein